MKATSLICDMQTTKKKNFDGKEKRQKIFYLKKMKFLQFYK